MNRSRRQHSTKFVELNTHLCQACWACVEACPNGVLGKIDIFFHKHAKIVDIRACKGCLKCVNACPNGAITSLIKKQNRQAQPEMTYE